MLEAKGGGEGGSGAGSATKASAKSGKYWHHMVSGAVAGGVTRMVVAPLDLLKIRFQVQGASALTHPGPAAPVAQGAGGAALAAAVPVPPAPPKYTSVLQAVRTIAREEGVFAFWKGTLPAQIMVIPYGGITFVTNKLFKRMLAADSLPAYARMPDNAVNLVCGALSGLCATSMTYPLDLLRTRLAVQRNHKARLRCASARAQIFFFFFGFVCIFLVVVCARPASDNNNVRCPFFRRRCTTR